jgi:hypothetical protein
VAEGRLARQNCAPLRAASGSCERGGLNKSLVSSGMPFDRAPLSEGSVRNRRWSDEGCLRTPFETEFAQNDGGREL